MGSARAKLFGAALGASLVLAGAVSAAAQESPPLQTTAPDAGGAPPAPTPAAESKGGDGDKGGQQQGPNAKQVREAHVKLRLKGLRRGRLDVGRRVTAAGTLRPFAKGERVDLILRRGDQTIKRKTVTVKQKKGSNLGQFALSEKLLRSGRYSVQAIHRRSKELGVAKDRTRKFRIRYPSLRQGNRGDDARLLNRLLERFGYVNDGGSGYDGSTARAVLAFRKVNNMARKTKATSSIFKRLANGKGGYKLRFGGGRHVEADLSRQVMVLADGKKVKEIYHVSTGAPATPTLTGSFRFYRREPGYNNKRMYYSVYYDRGYAIHGFDPVPTYPASHGCLRNPIPDAKHIYDWVEIGMPIHIYR